MMKKYGEQPRPKILNRTPEAARQEFRRLRRKILGYYKKYGRELPWRKTNSPYHILVSEFMLQQTQVSRVTDYYEKFINKLPDLKSLAKVKTPLLLKLWSGLGYNSRALRLRAAAQEIIKTHNGKFPEDAESLKKLPGIGDYTSAAILAFAFNKPVPVIDINIRRVLLHELGLANNVSNQELTALARLLIPRGKSALWHNALMDYGAALPPEVKKLYQPLTRQSSFKGSKREARGYILRILLKEKSLSRKELLEKISHRQKEEIIDQLAAEDFISVSNGIVRLK